MASRRRADPRSRYIALGAVVALHLLLLALAHRVAIAPHRLLEEVEDALVLLNLDRPREKPRVEPPPPARTPDVSLPQQTPVPSREQESPIQTPTPTTPLPPRQIDWRSNAARSAQLMVEEAGRERYRSFGPRKEPKPGEPQQPSAFGEPPKHKYGDVDTVGGDPVVWMNDNCYTELEKPVQTARDWVNGNPGQFAPPQIRCVSSGGAAQADGKMFEHIKKREEPPVPKAGTEMNELPERK